MIEKIKLLWSLMQYGNEVRNPEFWKKAQAEGQPVVLAILVALVALAKGFGYDIPISNEMLASVAAILFGLVNWILTKVTSSRAGVGKAPIEDHSFPAIETAPVDCTSKVSVDAAGVTETSAPIKPDGTSEVQSRFDKDTVERARAFIAGK